MEENPAGLKLKQACLDYPPKCLSNKPAPDWIGLRRTNQPMLNWLRLKLVFRLDPPHRRGNAACSLLVERQANKRFFSHLGHKLHIRKIPEKISGQIRTVSASCARESDKPDHGPSR
jgi:hypothetical protein